MALAQVPAPAFVPGEGPALPPVRVPAFVPGEGPALPPVPAPAFVPVENSRALGLQFAHVDPRAAAHAERLVRYVVARAGSEGRSEWATGEGRVGYVNNVANPAAPIGSGTNCMPDRAFVAGSLDRPRDWNEIQAEAATQAVRSAGLFG